MGSFKRSNTDSSESTSSRTEVIQGSKIPVMITERDDEEYPYDPQDTDIPAFTRTDSYYRAKTPKHKDCEYLKASDVKRQVQQAPPRHPSSGHYPRKHHNKPEQPLQAKPPYTEYPIVPTPQSGEAPGNYRNGQDPGPVRAFYNDTDRADFDVGYHDTKRAPRGPRNGRKHPNSHFSLASYHPAPTYTDTATLRRS